ncbi:DUF736 domain-containing protein [Bosea sp. (in: a-proteobacteria)]|uniref:DUF736 domain-containing protein n=1 Tax=Bosea sp. (in: a-proteobacteria) TaxID=1871050 RepID=UPI0025C627ED|nr:DUF736 domain-containing protein [Bosea sp. (in: a-proteobacteria)]
MATFLGTFIKTGEAFSGKLSTLSFSADIDLIAVEGGSDQAPDFRVYHGSREIGAAWVKRARRSESDYLSLKIQDLALGSLPVYPVLVQSEREPNTWNLLLNGRNGD